MTGCVRRAQGCGKNRNSQVCHVICQPSPYALCWMRTQSTRLWHNRNCQVCHNICQPSPYALCWMRTQSTRLWQKQKLPGVPRYLSTLTICLVLDAYAEHTAVAKTEIARCATLFVNPHHTPCAGCVRRAQGCGKNINCQVCHV